MTRSRRTFTAQEKAAIVMRHLVDKTTVSDQVVDYVNYWNKRAEVPAKQIVAWLGVGGSKYFDWKKRYGKANEHNGAIPCDHWLEDSERKAILDFHSKNPLEGYRRLTFMMLDADVVAASPSSVYRVLSDAGVLDRFNGKTSKKGPSGLARMR